MAAPLKPSKTPASSGRATGKTPTPTDATPSEVTSLRTLRRLLTGHGLSRALPEARDPVWPWLAQKVATRKNGEAFRVDVLNPQGSPHGWLLVVIDDQPFLTDTVSMAVRRHNPDLGGVWHPVLNVSRQRGKLVSATAGRATSRKALETWILVQILGLDPEGIDAMVADVRQSLTLSRAAVRDFAVMRDKMADLAEAFSPTGGKT